MNFANIQTDIKFIREKNANCFYHYSLGILPNKKTAACHQGKQQLWLLVKPDQRFLSMLSSTPAATAEPITPATLGPMACINRKLCGSDS